MAHVVLVVARGAVVVVAGRVVAVVGAAVGVGATVVVTARAVVVVALTVVVVAPRIVVGVVVVDPPAAPTAGAAGFPDTRKVTSTGFEITSMLAWVSGITSGAAPPETT